MKDSEVFIKSKVTSFEIQRKEKAVIQKNIKENSVNIKNKKVYLKDTSKSIKHTEDFEDG